MNTDDERAAAGWVPVLAEAALNRLRSRRFEVSTRRPDANGEWAARAEQLAHLCEREAGWMEVLARWVARQVDTVPLVLGRTAWEAAEYRRQRAAFWRDSAADWRRRQAGEPECGVLGCACGGVCGVPA